MHVLIGVIADAHGNGLAFDRGLSLLLSAGATQVFFLGDAVGYVPSASVLDSLAIHRDTVRCIRGNHESMLVAGQSDQEREPIYQLGAVRKTLTAAHLEMILSWPTSIEEEVCGRKLLLVHGSPVDPTNGYVYPDTDLDAFVPRADCVFMAHTHYPFIREHAGTCYVNVGSSGLPRDDGRLGAVALFEPSTRRVRIVRYDISAAAQQVVEQFPSLHPSVREVFNRRSENVVGEIL